ncbi:ndufaf3 [Acrasis kona]|uniref:Ndufaf3 n=1 Tax=Acrasis kona TaxID=1008807 RepID=A0AAW2YJG1_9EUKA
MLCRSAGHIKRILRPVNIIKRLNSNKLTSDDAPQSFESGTLTDGGLEVSHSQQYDQNRQLSEQRSIMMNEVNLIQHDVEKIMITGYTSTGFQFGSLRLFGSLLVFPTMQFFWTVNDIKEATIDSFSLLEYMNPTPQILIIGTGSTLVRLPRNVREHLLKNGINVEEMRTTAAISTFNVLSAEDRNVVCALIPPKTIDIRELTPQKAPGVFMQMEELLKNK